MAKTRANKEGNIRQRADGRYEVRVTTSHDFMTGKPKRISKYANTKEEAVMLLNQMSYINDTTPNNFTRITLGDWLELCLEVYMKNTLKQSTYLSYESYIRVHFKPALGNIPLQELTPRTLQIYYNYKAEHEGLAPKTIANLNLFLHRALDFAVAEGYINSNPASSVNLPRGDRPQIIILNRDEQMRLIQVSYQHRYGVFIRLVLFTGLRLGELLGLRWEDIDFQGRRLYVRRTLSRLNKTTRPTNPNEPTTEIVIQSPKSQNSIRSIPLIPQIMQDLQGWKLVQQNDRATASEAYCDSGFLVTNPSGSYVEPRTFKDYYNQILALGGLPHFTFHALRHTFASRATEEGMDMKTLSVIMGHASVSFTMDTYSHILDDHKQAGMALMENLFNAQQPTTTDLTYPVLVTQTLGFMTELSLPDFPEINCSCIDLTQGLAELLESIQEELRTRFYPPIPTAVSQIPCDLGQFILQLSVTG